MAAKLLIRDTAGNVVFDSSVQVAMSLIHKQRWSYVVTPQGVIPKIRVYNERITPTSTFAYLEFVSASANLTLYYASRLVSIKYYSGYLDIEIPSESTYNSNLTMTYDIKVYNR